jgi:hypothetical protein
VKVTKSAVESFSIGRQGTNGREEDDDAKNDRLKNHAV